MREGGIRNGAEERGVLCSTGSRVRMMVMVNANVSWFRQQAQRVVARLALRYNHNTCGTYGLCAK